MADPLSIAASVCGLVTVSSRVIFGLTTFALKVKETHKSLQRAVEEVRVVNFILLEVQNLIDDWQLSHGKRSNTPGLRFVQLDQLVTTLTGCVLVFSELEKHIDDCEKAESGSKPKMYWGRIWWAGKEAEIEKLMQDLDKHKTSLILILSLIRYNTHHAEVMDMMKQLCSLATETAESNDTIFTRSQAGTVRQDLHQPNDSASVRTGRTAVSTRSAPAMLRGGLEALRRKSKAYKHDRLWNVSMDSLPSLSTASTRRTTASEASLSEVPNISDISLPLCAEDLWNGDYYSEGVNTTSGAVRTDYTNATLGQHKIDGSLPASQARAPRLNPTLVAFSNTSFVRAFYGGFGNIGRAFVMNSVKIMPERPLLLAVRLAMNILLDDFRRGDEERAKRMSRVWVGALTTLITTGKDPTLVQAILDQCGADFVDLVDRGEVEEAKYYFRAGIEGLLGVVEAENKLMASFAVNTCARVLEHALTTPHAAQFVEVIDDISQRVSVSISFRGAMEAQITAIVGLMFVQLAVKLRMDNTLDCLMKVISVVQQRLFIAAHPHAWLTTVVSWEGHPWLAEMLVVAATLLLKFERGGVKVFEETVIAFLEGILRVAISANRLGDVLALISKFTDGRSDGTSPSPTLLDREQEGTVVGEVLCPPRDYSGVQDSDLGRALRKALVALTKK